MKILMCIWTVVLLFSVSCLPVSAADGAEVFDIQKGEVVKSFPHSAQLQSEVEKWLAAIEGPIGSMNIEPDLICKSVGYVHPKAFSFYTGK
ncbi:hypothetical protein [Paenibacillus chondroitinus]